jgi:hypothetical protein
MTTLLSFEQTHVRLSIFGRSKQAYGVRFFFAGWFDLSGFNRKSIRNNGNACLPSRLEQIRSGVVISSENCKFELLSVYRGYPPRNEMPREHSLQSPFLLWVLLSC